MAYAYTRLRNELLKALGKGFYALNTVIYEINLASPAQFAHYCVPYHCAAVFSDIGLNRISLLRRAVYNAHIPYAHKGHMQSARNRSGR